MDFPFLGTRKVTRCKVSRIRHVLQDLKSHALALSTATWEEWAGALSAMRECLWRAYCSVYFSEQLSTCPADCCSMCQWWFVPLEGNLWEWLPDSPKKLRVWPSLFWLLHLCLFLEEGNQHASTPCSWFWSLDHIDRPKIHPWLPDNEKSFSSCSSSITICLEMLHHVCFQNMWSSL